MTRTRFRVSCARSPSSRKITRRVCGKIAGTSDAIRFSPSPRPSTSGDALLAQTISSGVSVHSTTTAYAPSTSFSARRVGCEQGPPAPCTLEVSPYREYDGSVLTCPNSQTLVDVQVRVPASGRYQLDARVATGSGFQSECFGQDGSVPTLVTAADLDARREIFVETSNQPCPAP
mgnify:CR=1 FL=1